MITLTLNLISSLLDTTKNFSEITKPTVYFRNVDDTFVLFQNKKESKEYLIKLNGHSFLKFTSQKKTNAALFSTSLLNTPKWVMKPVFTTNLSSLVNQMLEILYTDYKQD